MTIEIEAKEIKIIKKFEGYAVARHNGNLGIWSVYTATELWNGNDFVACKPVRMAMQLADDCGSLLDTEHFEQHVRDLRAEANYLASLEA